MKAFADCTAAISLLTIANSPERLLAAKGAAAFELQEYEASLDAYESALSKLQPASSSSSSASRTKEYKMWMRKCQAEIDEEEAMNIEEAEEEARQIAKKQAIAAVDAKPLTAAQIRNTKAALMPKYQYYQNDKVMTISIIEPNASPENLIVDFGKDTLKVTLKKGGYDIVVINGTLFDGITPETCKVNYKADRVDLKVRKAMPNNWHSLFGSGARDEDEEGTAAVAGGGEAVGEASTTGESNDDDKKMAAASSSSSSEAAVPEKPQGDAKKKSGQASAYASDKDWNAIERNLKKEEEEEKPEGEEALNKLFKQIYGNATEDTRRAMVKSFQTSGGTVLSTNWTEVGEKNYEEERQAPNGMEWKNWEGNKLKQKEGDDK
jgi:hypothetical protein